MKLPFVLRKTMEKQIELCVSQVRHDMLQEVLILSNSNNELKNHLENREILNEFMESQNQIMLLIVDAIKGLKDK